MSRWETNLQRTVKGIQWQQLTSGGTVKNLITDPASNTDQEDDSVVEGECQPPQGQRKQGWVELAPAGIRRVPPAEFQSSGSPQTSILVPPDPLGVDSLRDTGGLVGINDSGS